MSKGSKSASGLAIAGLVLGIIGVVLSFIPIINNIAFILGIVALVFGVITLIQRRGVGISIAAVVLAIASIGITLAMQKSFGDAIDKASTELNKTVDDATGNNTEAILANDIQVDFGTFIAGSDENGFNSSKLPITVKNKTSERTSFTIKIEAVDANGARIIDDTVYANELNAGQSQEFDAFSLVQSDKYEALRAAAFKVISVSKV